MRPHLLAMCPPGVPTGRASFWQARMTRQYTVTTFDSRGDNRVTTAEDVTWEVFIDCLSSHDLVADKKRTAMFVPAAFRDDTGDYDPVVDEDTGVPVINPATGKPFVRRSAANVLRYSMVVADIDGGWTIPAAIEHFAEFTYFAYTSYNHLVVDEEHPVPEERFRIVLPLAEDCPVTEWYARRKAMLAWLGQVDRSTLAVSRPFYIPACHPDLQGEALVWTNKGRLLDWRVFAAETFEIPMVTGDAIVGTQATRYAQVALDREAEDLRSTAQGGRNPKLHEAAFNLGQLVAAGALDRVTVEARLTDAARGCGLADTEIRRTLRNGVEAGLRHPRRLPPPKPSFRDQLREMYHQKKQGTRKTASN